MKRREWLVLAGGGFLGGCASFGGGGGIRKWDGKTLDAVDSLARSNGCRGWAAWEQGSLKKSYRTHARGPALSITKAIAGLSCAKAMDEGWLDVSERASETLPEWRGVEGKESITVAMLLQMTAGLEDGARALYRGSIADKGKAAMVLRLEDSPGTQFRYGPACWEVLGEVLHRKAVARGESLERMLSRSVVRPVGLSSPTWRADQKGRSYLSTGTELTVTGLGRLGRTIGELMAGRDAAGISAASFRAVTRPSSANPMFGGGVWRNRRGAGGYPVDVEEVLDPPKSPSYWRSVCMSRDQPSSMVALIGSAGQRVFIWPDQGRVMARLGFSGSWRDQALLRAV